MRIRWSKSARAQLNAIVAYVAKGNPTAARALAMKLKNSVAGLKTHPQIGREVPELADPQIRERLVPPYRILYQLQPTFVLILGIHDSRLPLQGV